MMLKIIKTNTSFLFKTFKAKQIKTNVRTPPTHYRPLLDFDPTHTLFFRLLLHTVCSTRQHVNINHLH